jgi:hypothetical protein
MMARSIEPHPEAGYIDARPLTANSTKTSCDARPDHTLGQTRTSANGEPVSGFTLKGEAIPPPAPHKCHERTSAHSHHRAEMLGRILVAFVRIETGQLAEVRPELDLALGLARRLGARNFEAQAFLQSARLLVLEGDRSEAVKAANKALEISRAAGLAFIGPLILGTIARLAQDPTERPDVLGEAEAVLVGGAVGHNYFWFYRNAIDVALDDEDWSLAERYATGLEAYTASEPIVWADLITARGRALAAFGRGRCDQALSLEFVSLRREADRLGRQQVIPALDRALKAVGTT